MGGSKSKANDGDDTPTKADKRKNSLEGSPDRGSKRKSAKKGGGGGMDLAALSRAKNMAKNTSQKLDEKDPSRKWKRIRDQLLVEVGQSELAARAAEAQVGRLEANTSKLEKECHELYKKLKKLKKALRKIGREKDDIEEYLEELHVEQEHAFEHAEVAEHAVDTFMTGKAREAGKKIIRQNALIKAFGGKQ